MSVVRSLEIAPCDALRPYVRLYWVLEMEDPAHFGPAERITPDGLVEVVFHYRTPFACRYAGGEFELQPTTVAVSQVSRFVEIYPEGPTGMVSVRFQPWGAYHFFRPPVSEIADRQVPADAMWGRAVIELEERLAVAKGLGYRIGLVEQFLLSQIRQHEKQDIEPFVREMWRRRGNVSMPGLCADLGVGERTLQRTFARALGTTPKRFARLSRFLHSCNMLRTAIGCTLTEIGLACGYYDQSHFNAEFRGFAGMTPGQFIRSSSVSFLDIE